MTKHVQLPVTSCQVTFQETISIAICGLSSLSEDKRPTSFHEAFRVMHDRVARVAIVMSLLLYIFTRSQLRRSTAIQGNLLSRERMMCDSIHGRVRICVKRYKAPRSRWHSVRIRHTNHAISDPQPKMMIPVTDTSNCSLDYRNASNP